MGATTQERQVVIGTRGSDLALAQARWVAAELAAQGVEARLEIIRTQGDRVQHLSLDKLEGKGFFTKELEEALLAERIDLAVHSLKDLPTESPPGLQIAAIPVREDVRDCVVAHPEAWQDGGEGSTSSNGGEGLMALCAGMRVGTSAARRKAQLAALRPDLVAVDIRGNVPTRVRKVGAPSEPDAQVHAVVLAAAGLARLRASLDLEGLGLVLRYCAPEQFVPAPGQGALGLQIRAGDDKLATVLGPLQDAPAARRVAAERGVLAALDGGCHLPLGVHSWEVSDGAAAGGAIGLRVFLGDTERYGPMRTITAQGDQPAAAVAAALRALGLSELVTKPTSSLGASDS